MRETYKLRKLLNLPKMTKAEEAVINDIECENFEVYRYRCGGGEVKYGLCLRIEVSIDGRDVLTFGELKAFCGALNDGRVTGWDEGQPLELDVEEPEPMRKPELAA